MERIRMEHGSGGRATGELIGEIFEKAFSNETLSQMEDAAVVAGSGMIAVTTAPSKTANIFLDVSFSQIVSSLPPAIFDRPFPMVLIPYKNKESPPIILNTLKISIAFSFST